MRRACRAARLRRRYGCFRLPHVQGAHAVREAKRKDVSWLARTDPDRKVVEFSEHWDALTPVQKRYIVLHERAHLETGPDHTPAFYEALKRLVEKAGMPWKTAFELEIWNCGHKN